MRPIENSPTNNKRRKCATWRNGINSRTVRSCGHRECDGYPYRNRGQSIQLTQNQGRWSVAIKTPLKTIDFDLN
jgi:hypothetical protein